MPLTRKRAGLVAGAALITTLLALPHAGAQQAPTELRGAYLAANCANCHGTAGRSRGVMPALAGVPKERFVQTMREFRDGQRPATLMHQIAKGYTDEQIELMAAYFAAQAPR